LFGVFGSLQRMAFDTVRCGRGYGVSFRGNTAICETDYPVVVRIRDAILVFNVLMAPGTYRA
jgi:hypothetical protein